MPISLPPLSRREFIGGLSASLALLAGRRVWADDRKVDPHRVVLFSDTHIAANRDTADWSTMMFPNLEQAVKEVLAEAPDAGQLLINGDCAYKMGEAGDYFTLLDGLKPLREAGIPIHLALGNHDHRGRFWKAFEVKEDKRGAVDGRQLEVIKTPRANIFLLDSLDQTNVTPGVLGEAQLGWLNKALDAASDKPALVFVHHNPDEKEKPTGLTDTKALWDALLPRKHVKALIYGHTHDWNPTKREDLHSVNLPAVAYVFTPGKAQGWVDLKLEEKGATLQLHCLDKTHKQHMNKVELAWR